VAEPSLPSDEQEREPTARPLIAPPWSSAAAPAAPHAPRPAAVPTTPDDGRSFTERYRGTQWDTSQVGALTPTDLAPARRRGPSILLLAGVGMLLAVVALTGVILYTDSQRPAYLPAAVLPTSSPESTTPTATATPQSAISPSPAPSVPVSAPPASATPGAPASATPKAPLVLPDDPAAAFVARMLHGASYSVKADGEFDFGGEKGSWGFAMDVAGRDLSGVFKIHQKRIRIVTDIIVKDGVQYDKLAGEGWVREEGVPEGMPMDLFATTQGPQSWDGLEYVGSTTRNQRQLHHLRLPAALLPGLSAMWIDEYDGGLVLNDFSFDLWITDDGRPQSSDLVFDGTVRSAGVEIDMTFNMRYSFSRWGDDIVIERPAHFTDPGYTDG
jgi:hypothetical protein